MCFIQNREGCFSLYPKGTLAGSSRQQADNLDIIQSTKETRCGWMEVKRG